MPCQGVISILGMTAGEDSTSFILDIPSKYLIHPLGSGSLYAYQPRSEQSLLFVSYATQDKKDDQPMFEVITRLAAKI